MPVPGRNSTGNSLSITLAIWARIGYLSCGSEKASVRPTRDLGENMRPFLVVVLACTQDSPSVSPAIWMIFVHAMPCWRNRSQTMAILYNNAMWSNRQVREWLEGSSSSSSDEEDYDVTRNVAVSELNRMKRKFLEGNVDSSSSSSGWPDDTDDDDDADFDSSHKNAPKPYASRAPQRESWPNH